MILFAWFNHPEKSFSYKEVQLKEFFCQPVKAFAILLKALMKTRVRRDK